MRPDTGHPSDELLLLDIDRELSRRRRLALYRHLRRCEPCRVRWDETKKMTEVVAGWPRDQCETDAAVERLRQRLHVNMATLSRRWDRSVWFRVGRGLAMVPLMLRMGASLALTVVVLQLVSSWPEREPSPRRSAAIDVLAMPNRAATPGAARTVSRQAICAGRFARSAISPATRQAVLHAYRMEGVAEHEYELDYLITPELGGLADARNLWPERYASGTWNARVKDDLERLLPQLVCQGRIDLETAQRAIADNWIAAYQEYLDTDRPLAREAHPRDDDDEDGERLVALVRAAAVPLWARAPQPIAWATSLETGVTMFRRSGPD